MPTLVVIPNDGQCPDGSGPVLKIRLAGFLEDHFVIDAIHARCGTLNDDISISFEGKAGGVMSWEDFEAAYLEIKRRRSVPPIGTADVKEIK